jgi:histidyl-tRNA synthetase
VADYAIKLAQIIRDDDIPSIIDYRFSSLKSQLSKANELGVLVTLIIGPKEMEENKLTIKNMKTQKQKVIDVDALLDEIYDILEKYADN